jgi:hypothetical protein
MRSEAVIRLIRDFYSFKQEHPEMSIKEIAKHFKVDYSHVYRLTYEIAKNEGVSRDDLVRPIKKSISRKSRIVSKHTAVDHWLLSQNLEALYDDIKTTLYNIEEYKKTLEEK